MEYNRYIQTLTELNRVNLTRTADYNTLEEIFKGKMVDNRNRIVGEIRDVLISRNGTINSIYTEFNRLHLQQKVFLNYRDLRISPSKSGYVIGFDANKIEEMYPALLAQIEPASGKDDGLFSIRALKGAPVKTKSGKTIGKVQTVLFAALGSRAEALQVILETGIKRGHSAAIPFNSVTLESSGGRKQVILGDAQAEAFMDFIR